MPRKSDHIEYRGWRIWVATPLGFFALALMIMVPVLAGLALAETPYRGVAVGALIILPTGLVILVARLAVLHPTALSGTRTDVREEQRLDRRRTTGRRVGRQRNGRGERA